MQAQSIAKNIHTNPHTKRQEKQEPVGGFKRQQKNKQYVGQRNIEVLYAHIFQQYNLYKQQRKKPYEVIYDYAIHR